MLHLHAVSNEGTEMVDVAQLVRATDCGSVGRGFEPHLPPLKPDDIRLFCLFKSAAESFPPRSYFQNATVASDPVILYDARSHSHVPEQLHNHHQVSTFFPDCRQSLPE